MIYQIKNKLRKLAKEKHFETFYEWLSEMKVRLLRIVPDKLFIECEYYANTGKCLNLKNPQTFNEKLQWLKLYDRKPIYTTMVDKYAVKRYVSDIIGSQYIVPTFGVWDRFDDIDFDELPNRFVLKCTHDSGGIVIVKNKSMFDVIAAKKRIEKNLRRNYYYRGREWPYKNVKPRILAEMYLEDKGNAVLTDYKVLCFEGEAKLVEVHQGRGTANHTQDFYDMKWEKTNIEQEGDPNSSKLLTKPVQMDQIIELSNILASNTHHVRVDWYIIGGDIFFGELTFFDSSGLCRFTEVANDNLLGSWIRLQSEVTR